MNKNSGLQIGKIIEDCKRTLEISLSENKELKQKHSALQDRIHDLGKQVDGIDKEERMLRRENDEWSDELNEKTKVLGYIQQLIDIMDTHNNSFEYDVQHHPAYKKIINLPKAEKSQGEDIIKSIQQTEAQLINLEAFYQQLEDESLKLRQSGSFWTCSRCNITLMEGQNDESCTFHPGRLKYFSCRSCGGDEYFTCCNQCRDCNKGCTQGLHKP